MTVQYLPDELVPTMGMCIDILQSISASGYLDFLTQKFTTVSSNPALETQPYRFLKGQDQTERDHLIFPQRCCKLQGRSHLGRDSLSGRGLLSYNQ